MESWGVHGHNISQSMLVVNITLLSTAGMGFRCDICHGKYSLVGSKVQIKQGSARPLSITADAAHFMHNANEILIENSSFEGQGDDGLNVHGNFIVTNETKSCCSFTYIDETGPGWLTNAPTYFVGDSKCHACFVLAPTP